jgi:hypothetical protein
MPCLVAVDSLLHHLLGDEQGVGHVLGPHLPARVGVVYTCPRTLKLSMLASFVLSVSVAWEGPAGLSRRGLGVRADGVMVSVSSRSSVGGDFIDGDAGAGEVNDGLAVCVGGE